MPAADKQEWEKEAERESNVSPAKGLSHQWMGRRGYNMKAIW